MPEIIKLDDLVPDDIVFNLRGKDYPIPGDLGTKDVFKLYRLFSDLNTAKTKGDQAAEIEAAGAKLEAGLLELFRIQTPDLEALPFGVSSLAIVTPRVLQLLGVNLTAEDPDESPPPRPPARRRTSGSTTRQTRKKSSR